MFFEQTKKQQETSTKIIISKPCRRRYFVYSQRLIINAAYWGMGMEADINPESSVDYVGAYEPLASGFNDEKLGVVPKLPAAFK